MSSVDSDPIASLTTGSSSTTTRPMPYSAATQEGPWCAEEAEAAEVEEKRVHCQRNCGMRIFVLVLVACASSAKIVSS
jgi:hypothetical protein